MSKNQFTGLCWKAQGLRMSCQYSKRPNGSSCCNGCSTMLQHPVPCKDSLKAGPGNSEPSFIEHIMSFQPKCWGQVMKATEKSHTKHPNISQNYAAALIVATFISSQWSTSQKLLATTSCTTALPPVSNTTCRKVITLRQCLKGHADMLTHEHDLCTSFLWVSLVSFSGWVLL